MKTNLPDRVASIEFAIAKLRHTKQQLDSNAELVKIEIQEAFECNYDLIRKQMNDFIFQVDSTVRKNNHYFDKQMALLKHLLENCRRSLKTTDTGDSVGLDNILNSFSIANLEPKKFTTVKFEAEKEALRNSIMNFGHLTISQNNEISTLPYSLEDYDDEDYERHYFNPICNNLQKTFEMARSGRTAGDDSTVDSDQILIEIENSRSVLRHQGSVLHNWLHNLRSSCESEPEIFNAFKLERTVPTSGQSVDYFAVAKQSTSMSRQSTPLSSASFEMISAFSNWDPQLSSPSSSESCLESTAKISAVFQPVTPSAAGLKNFNTDSAVRRAAIESQILKIRNSDNSLWHA